MRVVVTHIGQDGAMLRRVVDTARCADGPRWEGLATRALLVPPPYHPVPSAPIYHVSVDNRMMALVAEPDLCGPMLDLVTAVLAMGEALLTPLRGLQGAFARTARPLGLIRRSPEGGRS